MERKMVDEKRQLKRKKSFDENREQIKRGKQPVEEKERPSTECRFHYDVFISFRGEDTRNGFTSHLYKELTTYGINTFIDSENLEKGENISVLFERIEGSKIFLPVFSKNYADSKWCLKEITKMVEIHKREGKKRPIIPIFYRVVPSNVRQCKGSFGEAFKNHQEDNELGEEEINEWKTALKAAGELSGHTLSKTKNEADIITCIRKRVSEILCKVLFNIQPIGIDPCIHTLKQMLEREKDGICMIGICGLGGIGKTTLAMALYNGLSPTFEGSCFLSDIRSKSEGRDGLPTLQAELMNQVLRGQETHKIVKIEQGVSLIKQSLGARKVLLILDDVDDIEQLEAFTANRRTKEKWLGKGSKVIVTTRDETVLVQHGLQKDDDIYFPEGLNTEDSLQLFCHHAFGSDQPLVGFEELSLEVVEVTQGLPLALKVFGPLFGELKEKEEWEEMLEILKRDQHKKVHERLKVSYDSLNRNEQSVFLDIACFFIGCEQTYPFYMWGACDFFPRKTLKVLQHKSLIKINERDRFEMHDQIRDMGRMIVKAEGNSDPLKCSRPWTKDQMLGVLRDAQENPYVHRLDFHKVYDYNEHINMSWRVIEKMHNLRMIIGANSWFHSFEEGEETVRLPSNIRWLEFRCSYQTLTFHNDRHEQLCVLDLSFSEFQDFGSDSMVFPKLKVLNLGYCDNLIQTPDFTHLPSLEALKLDDCGSLAEMDESIGQLGKLVQLSLSSCRKLKGLPAGLCKLSSLESLDLGYCEGILVLPTQIGDLTSLKYLNLEGTSISVLPDSIGSLQSLEQLCLTGCKGISKLPIQIGNLTSLKELGLCWTSISALPDSIGSLQFLEKLDLYNCGGISILPKQIGYLTSLKNLGLVRTAISALPDSIGCLGSLEKLDLHGCERISILPRQIGYLTSLKELLLYDTSISALPDSIGNLKSLERLSLNGCKGISNLPKQVGDLTSLKVLELDGTSISALPDSIGSLQSLENLSLNGCVGILKLPKQIGDLTSLKKLALKKTSISALPESIGNLQSLEWLNLKGCKGISILPKQIGDLTSLNSLELKGTSISALPDSIGSLQYLQVLDLSECTSLQKIPDSIGNLKRLSRLPLEKCKLLEKLPNSMGMLTSLNVLDIRHCTSLREVPDSLVDLNAIYLEGCILLEKLPNSIKTGNSSFRFDGCKSLKRLPDFLGDGTIVWLLSLRDCESLKVLPDSVGMRMEFLEELDMSGCTLLEGMPESIGNLKHLERLSLKHCHSLEELPKCIGMLLSLKKLDLSGCTLLIAMPESIENLKNLEHLVLSGCTSLEELPKCIGRLLTLELLNLSGCTLLTTIPETISGLSRLTHLNLQDCRSLEELPESMEGLKSLKVLHIGGGMSIKKVLDCIRKLTDLEELYLRVIEEIPDSIGMLMHVNELHLLGCNPFHCRSLKKLLESIEHLEYWGILHICGGMSVNNVPNLMYQGTNLVLSELEEIPELVDVPAMEVILIQDCPKLESLPHLPSLLVSLGIIGCAAFRKLPDPSALNCLKILYLAGCKAFNDLSGLGSLKSLEELALTDQDGLSCDSMEKLSQASFEKLKILHISGASDGSCLQFGLPKSKTGHVQGLLWRCYLTEELSSYRSNINIRIQVPVEGKIVPEVTRTATRTGYEDDYDEELGKWGLGGPDFYEINSKEEKEIVEWVEQGNATLRVVTTYNLYRLRTASLGVSYGDQYIKPLISILRNVY